MHFSCLVQDIHRAAPPWCTASIFQRPSIEPSPSFDSPPTSKLDARTLSQTSASVIPPFLRLTPRRAISGRRMGPPEFIILDNFSSTRIASFSFFSLNSFLDRAISSRDKLDRDEKILFSTKVFKDQKEKRICSRSARFYRENRICKNHSHNDKYF